MTNDPGTPPGGGIVPGTPESRPSDRLQSMLAQAVEGQQSEQRELSGALTDMRNQIVRLGQEISEFRSTRTEGGAEPAVINNLAVELREGVRFLSERLDGVTRMVAQRGEDLADIRGAVSALDTHLRSQTETLGVLSQGLQALPSYGERISALHDAVGSVNSRIAALESAVAKAGDDSAIVQRLAGLESAVKPLGEQVAQGRDAGADHGASLAKQAESLADLHEKVSAIAEGTQAALAVPPVFDESWIQGIEAKLSALAANVAALSGGDAAQQSEERLRAHIDDAVIALAEALVRRRPLTAPEPPNTAAPAARPAAATLTSPVNNDDEHDDTPVVDFSVAEFGDEDGDKSEVESDDTEPDATTVLDDDADEYADDADEYDGEDQDAAEDAAIAATDESFFSLFPDESAHDSHENDEPSHEHASWAPELPPERRDAEPSTGTIVPEDRKRRWFSR